MNEPAKITGESATAPQEEARLQAVFSAIVDPILIYDRAGVVQSANKASRISFGFDPVGLRQRQLLEKIDLRLIDGRRMQVSDMASSHALKGEVARNISFTFRNGNGETRAALGTAAPIRRNGEVVGALAYWIDISEQKKMEDDLAWEAREHAAMADLAKALLREAPLDAISALMLDYAKKLTDSPTGFTGYIDPSTGDLVCPTPLQDGGDLCKVEGKDIVFKGASAASGLGGWVWKYKKPLLTNAAQADPRSRGIPEGHIPISRFLGVPAIFRDACVGLIGLANSKRDYTERDLMVAERLAALYALAIHRKRDEDAVRESREQYRALSENLEDTVRQKVSELKQAERLAGIGQMVSVIAHEIRNPLQNISLGLEVVRAALSGFPDALEAADQMAEGVESLGRMVEDILNYSRPVSLKYSSVRIENLIRSAVAAVEHRLAGINLALDIDDGEVSVDIEKLSRTMVNLMMNSIEAMPEGGTLSVSSCFHAQGAKNYLFLSVSDTGSGISPDDLERIQDPFFTTKSQGTGLGLSICKKIVEAHAGALWFRSRPGEGTTADICIPAEPPSLRETPRP